MGILLTMYKGRRYKNELLNLKWTQVDWDLNKVLLPETKTGKSSFSIDRLTRSVFRKMWAYKTKRFKNIKSVKSRYVFPSTRKGKKPYIQDIRKYSKHTIRNYKIDLVQFIKYLYKCDPNLLVLDIQKENIQEYLFSLHAFAIFTNSVSLFGSL